MANYNQLKASISAVIKSNNRNEITGQILQNVLNQMVGVIGENYQLAGFATPLTNPGAPDQNVFYVADQGGAYVNFDNIVLDAGLSFLMWKNSQWTSHTVNIVTAEWVEQNYVSIDFFRSLFRAYDVNGDEILPNNPADPITEEQTVVDSIKAMVGFWTEQYISALGHGTGGGGGGGGGGATVLDDLLDVTIINPLVGQGLIYNGTKWVNQNIPSGTDMSTVWSALAGATNQQINISHLTDALATYATQSWVGQNYISIAYFDRLFRAYNGNTLVSHNDTTSTIDNIKAMFGFWTEFYVSALGTGGIQSPIGLASLNDVQLSTLSDGQALVYNATSGKWVNRSYIGNYVNSININDTTYLPSEDGRIYNVLIKELYYKTEGDSSLMGYNNQLFYGRVTSSSESWVNDIDSYGQFAYLNVPWTANYGLQILYGVNSSIVGFRTRTGGSYSSVDLFCCTNNFSIIINGTEHNCYRVGRLIKIDLGNISGGGTSGSYLPLTGGTVNGTTNINLIEFPGGQNIINSQNGYTLYINYTYNNDVVLCRNGGRVGVGIGPSYKLHVDGTIYATGSVTALSDARKKDVIGDKMIAVEQIANAPAVQFLWKGERAKEGMQVGTLAQYWQGVLPEVVMDKGGELSMQYGVAALVSAIITARKVVDHERRISELESRLKIEN